MKRAVFFALAAVTAICSPFFGMLVGRGAYHALIWFSRELGFTPAADPALQAEALGGIVFGFIGFAFVATGAAGLVQHGLQAATNAVANPDGEA